MKNLKSYLVYLSRNRLFTLVNVLGLSLSLMFVLLLSNVAFQQYLNLHSVEHPEEVSVLAFEKWEGIGNEVSMSHYNMGVLLEKTFPAVKSWTAVSVNFNKEAACLTGESKLKMDYAIVRDNYFDFMGQGLQIGNTRQFAEPGTVVISPEFAEKLGMTPRSAIGKELRFEIGKKEYSFKVVGVTEQQEHTVLSVLPECYFNFDLMDKISPENGPYGTTDFIGACDILVRTQLGTTIDQKQMKKLIIDNVTPAKVFDLQAILVPLSRMITNDMSASLMTYNRTYLIVYLLVSIVVLLMAIFNYTTMSVAQVGQRAKEMAMRRLLGTSPRRIFLRMMGEACFLVVIALLLALFLGKAIEPEIRTMLGMPIRLIDISSMLFPVSLLILWGVISILSGVFPALLMIRLHPLEVAKGIIRRKMSSILLRIVVVVQMAISMAMLGIAGYFYLQMNHILHLPVGYDYTNVLIYDYYQPSTNQTAVIDAFRRLPFVKRVGTAAYLPIWQTNTAFKFDDGGTERKENFCFYQMDSTAFNIFKFHVEQRNTVSLSDSTDDRIYLTREGYRVAHIGDDATVLPARNKTNRIIIEGRISDFKAVSATSAQMPKYIAITAPERNSQIVVEIDEQSVQPKEAKLRLDAVYTSITEASVAGSEWYEELYRENYKDELQMQGIVQLFGGVSLLIALLGIISLNIFYVRQRRRDMAIRKVFGSDNRTEMVATLRFVLKSIGVALLPAIPLYLIGIRKTNTLLTIEGYTYWWVFIVTFVCLILFSLLIVYVVTRTIIRENPINHLKSE